MSTKRRHSRTFTGVAPNIGVACMLALALAGCIGPTSPTSQVSPTLPKPTAFPTTSAVASSTAAASSLPGAPPCEPDTASANTPAVRPAGMLLGCATSADGIDAIVWTKWTATEAAGNGTHSVNDCKPNCAQGKYTRLPAAITLTNPASLGGLYVFTTISIRSATTMGQPESVTADHLYGAWGWVP